MPSKFSAYTDEDLVLQYSKEQNKDALGELFSRYQHLAVSVCHKYLQNLESSKDAVMQVFEKVMIELPKHDVVYFKAWLLIVCKNHCLMQLRKASLPTKFVENIENYDVENGYDLHLAIEKEKQMNSMHEALGQLEEKQKLCLDLFYLQKKSYTEIQSETGFTFMEVKSFIQNGKRNLKNSLTTK
jgi:RNA polymerase sigma factor (sigma-70 family)